MTNVKEGSMHASLICISGKYAGKTFHVQDNATIGRDGDNEILLDAMVVSNQHARLFYDAAIDSFIIEDLRSRTGVMIDDAFVDERAPIRDGQQLTIANEFQFTFHIHASPPDIDAVPQPVEKGNAEASDHSDTKVTNPPPSSRAPGPDAPKSADMRSADQEESAEEENENLAGTTSAESEDKPGVISQNGNGVHAPQDASETPEASETVSRTYYLERSGVESGEVTFTLSEGINLVGRDPTNTIHIQDASVSRHHAVIIVKNFTLVVRDLDSKNHTFVDGLHVEHERPLKPGSLVLFGLVGFIVREKS